MACSSLGIALELSGSPEEIRHSAGALLDRGQGQWRTLDATPRGVDRRKQLVVGLRGRFGVRDRQRLALG